MFEQSVHLVESTSYEINGLTRNGTNIFANQVNRFIASLFKSANSPTC